jgi:hypothetical protein
MTREEAARVRREFNDTLAVELESHLNNGSEFIFNDGDPSEEVVKLRVQILKGVVRTLQFRGSKGKR